MIAIAVSATCTAKTGPNPIWTKLSTSSAGAASSSMLTGGLMSVSTRSIASAMFASTFPGSMTIRSPSLMIARE
ncbi:MAG: hypothetical protein ACR2FU_09065 [Streptosporangiaceae bacterium]